MTNFIHRAHGFTTDSSHWSFTLTTSGTVSETSAESTFSAAVVGFFTDTNVKGYYSTGFKLDRTTTWTTSATFHTVSKTVTTQSTFGTSSSTQLPTALCPVWTLESNQVERWGRGRVYLPTPTVGSLSTSNTGALDTTHATNIGTALANLATALQGGGLTMILWTRRATQDGRAAYQTVPVVSRSLSLRYGAQHRRNQKNTYARVNA